MLYFGLGLAGVSTEVLTAGMWLVAAGSDDELDAERPLVADSVSSRLRREADIQHRVVRLPSA